MFYSIYGCIEVVQTFLGFEIIFPRDLKVPSVAFFLGLVEPVIFPVNDRSYGHFFFLQYYTKQTEIALSYIYHRAYSNPIIPSLSYLYRSHTYVYILIYIYINLYLYYIYLLIFMLVKCPLVFVR